LFALGVDIWIIHFCWLFERSIKEKNKIKKRRDIHTIRWHAGFADFISIYLIP
jgi:hypothetical protein